VLTHVVQYGVRQLVPEGLLQRCQFERYAVMRAPCKLDFLRAISYAPDLTLSAHLINDIDAVPLAAHLHFLGQYQLLHAFSFYFFASP
jgi:hypothetical protein